MRHDACLTHLSDEVEQLLWFAQERVVKFAAFDIITKKMSASGGMRG